MPYSIDRILTTHVGSLPRPVKLLDMMKARLAGGNVDRATYDQTVSAAVHDTIKQQAECGIDIVCDGEMSKSGFFAYARQRLDGFEPQPDERRSLFPAETSAFPDYYADYFERAMLGGSIMRNHALRCVGPINYVGQDALRVDLENLKAVVDEVDCVSAFVPATAPSGVGYNGFYDTDEEYFMALAEAMREEYLAIVDAGFLLQIDDPGLSDIFADPELNDAAKNKKADMYVESINHGIRDIPAEKIRFHTCYGINEGPRIYEAPLGDIVEHMLKVNANVYSFEAANPRHEHEYRIWETVKLPEGKSIMPGVITHASNIVEHPELIAEWLLRFAKLVGRNNIIAGADCGFSSQASYRTEVHPTVIWEKFKAMREGANIASSKLWPKNGFSKS